MYEAKSYKFVLFLQGKCGLLTEIKLYLFLYENEFAFSLNRTAQIGRIQEQGDNENVLKEERGSQRRKRKLR